MNSENHSGNHRHLCHCWSRRQALRALYTLKSFRFLLRTKGNQVRVLSKKEQRIEDTVGNMPS